MYLGSYFIDRMQANKAAVELKRCPSLSRTLYVRWTLVRFPDGSLILTPVGFYNGQPTFTSARMKGVCEPHGWSRSHMSVP